MKLSRRNLSAAVFLASTAALLPNGQALADAADASAVEAAVANLTKAMLAADRGKLEALTVDQLSYGHSSGKIETKKEFVEIVGGKKTVYKSIELSKQTVVVVGNNAIVRHAWESESGPGDGKWSVSKIGVMQVWAKQGADWKLLARQAFKV